MAFKSIGNDLTLFKSGQLYVSRAAAEQYFQGAPLVRVEYDPEANIVSLSPTSQAGGATRRIWGATRGTQTMAIGMLFRKFHFRLKKNVYANFERQNGRLVFRIPEDAIEKTVDE
ncbi:hypothetical protein C4565_03775 [Candidatus Parcubacteria bacterium]|nr:MAG: hypothetical protein C4565_03775 [Candidatus Parcubacteria bacterium]